MSDPILRGDREFLRIEKIDQSLQLTLIADGPVNVDEVMGWARLLAEGWNDKQEEPV